MDHLKHSWPGLGMKCTFCSHSKCRDCLDVSVNVLACCNCRQRAVRRLADLKEMYRLRSLDRTEEPQLAPHADMNLPDDDDRAPGLKDL